MQKKISETGAVPEGNAKAMLRSEWLAQGTFPGSSLALVQLGLVRTGCVAGTCWTLCIFCTWTVSEQFTN